MEIYFGLDVIPTNKCTYNDVLWHHGVIIIANELGVQDRAKHYPTRYHHELGEINLLKVLTDDYLANLFTKALPKGKLTQDVESIGLCLASSLMHICV